MYFVNFLLHLPEGCAHRFRESGILVTLHNDEIKCKSNIRDNELCRVRGNDDEHNTFDYLIASNGINSGSNGYQLSENGKQVESALINNLLDVKLNYRKKTIDGLLSRIFSTAYLSRNITFSFNFV